MIKFNIGSRDPELPDPWLSYDIQHGANLYGDCRLMKGIGKNSVGGIYASHVLEHMTYTDIQLSLKTWHQILKPGAELMVSVPDFELLAKLFVHPETTSAEDKGTLLHMIFGGQVDAYDIHMAGLTHEFLGGYIQEAGFTNVARVKSFDLFNDSSTLEFHGVPISLNLRAIKP